MKSSVMCACFGVVLASACLADDSTNQVSKLSWLTPPQWLHASASTAILSSYQLYGAIFNDEPSWTYQVSLDVDLPWNAGSFGGGFWTLSDITDRCSEYNSKWNKETDLDLHWFNSYSFTDDIRLDYGLLYIWFNYYHTHGGNMDTQRSLILDTALDNPWITPFFAVEWQHAYDEGVMLKYGVRRTFTPSDAIPLTITPSVYLTTGSGRFIGGLFPSKPDGSDYSFGIGHIFAELQADYMVYEWFKVYAKAVWMSALNGDIRDAIDEAGGTYHKDWLQAEIGVTFSF